MNKSTYIGITLTDNQNGEQMKQRAIIGNNIFDRADLHAQLQMDCIGWECTFKTTELSSKEFTNWKD